MLKTEKSKSAVMPTYNRFPVSFEYGEGCYLIDTEGNRYLDAISGIAVCSLGHNHPAFTTTLSKQAAKLIHTSNIYHIPLQEELAQSLCHAAGMEKAFFCNSGTEANEAAIKIARMYGHNKNIDKPAIVVMEGAFHGRTMGALSATDGTKHKEGFSPLLEGFIRVPYDDVEAVRQAVADNPDVVAVLVEPIQGESGVRTPGADYLNGLQDLCRQHDLLLMLDEVQTGNGRTGKYFAFQHDGIVPDVLTTAKGLGNGFPIGACLAGGRAADVFQAGHHATTFGGSPLACAAGLAVNKALLTEELVDNAARRGDDILSGLRERLAGCDVVADIRGRGLMIGVELTRPCVGLATAARAHGVLVTIQAETVIRLLPPLILNEDDAEKIIETIALIVREFANDS